MKTKKLKKLWAKFQESEQNLKDEKKAFQVSNLLLKFEISNSFICMNSYSFSKSNFFLNDAP